MGKLATLTQNQGRLGFFPGLKWTIFKSLSYRGLGPSHLTIHPKMLRHPLLVRMKESSDIHVVSQIFVQGELDGWQCTKATSVGVILDLGANVGYTSALFLNLFPDAFVLAVEPDPLNAEVCRRNLAPYGGRAKVVEGAVWHKRGRLALSRGAFRDGLQWATQVRAPQAGETATVVAWDVPALLEMCPRKTVDILKVDIEGSERDLFSYNACEWLHCVRNLCIEFHGPECQEAVVNALAGYYYETSSSGEYHFYLGVRSRSAPPMSAGG